MEEDGLTPRKYEPACGERGKSQNRPETYKILENFHRSELENTDPR